jgi:hypothetical protein
VRSVHESDTAEGVMPGRLVAGPWTLNPGMGVRFAPRQPIWKTKKEESYERALLRIRGVVKATVTSLGKKHTVSTGSLLRVARSSNWPG